MRGIRKPKGLEPSELIDDDPCGFVGLPWATPCYASKDIAMMDDRFEHNMFIFSFTMALFMLFRDCSITEFWTVIKVWTRLI